MDRIEQMPASLEQVRYANRVQVLGAFLEGGVFSAGEVAEKIGLSRQTVMKAVQFFLRTGLLASAGKGESTSLGGKRPELFCLTRDRFFLCITMWPEYLHIRLTTISGEPVGDLVREEPLPADPKEALRRVGRLAAELVRDSGHRTEQVRAVSISAAGIMDYKTGSLRYSSQSPQWGVGVPLAQSLRQWFPEALILPENTGKMTARPFLQEQELRQKRILVIFACWGLSGCLIDRGSILSGRNSLIGEIGHMTIDPADPEVCGCGSRGCLERQVSAERLREKAKQWAAECGPSMLEPLEELSIPGVFRASKAGDELARRLSGYLAECFAIALRNVALAYDPDVVVFQGDYAEADDHFRQTLMDRVGQFRYFSGGIPFELRFDHRELTEMDTQGSLIALTEGYFSQPGLYMD